MVKNNLYKFPGKFQGLEESSGLASLVDPLPLTAVPDLEVSVDGAYKAPDSGFKRLLKNPSNYALYLDVLVASRIEDLDYHSDELLLELVRSDADRTDVMVLLQLIEREKGVVDSMTLFTSAFVRYKALERAANPSYRVSD
jgi:hypothetical protein